MTPSFSFIHRCGFAFSPLAVLLSSSTLIATPYEWNQGIGGTWNSPAMWDPNGIPGSGDTAAISEFGDSGNPYDVSLSTHTTIDGFALTSPDATFRSTSLNFTVNGPSQWNGSNIVFGTSTYHANGVVDLSSGSYDFNDSNLSGTGSLNKTGGILTMRDSDLNVPVMQDGGSTLILEDVRFSATFDNNVGTLEVVGPTDVNLHTVLNLGANDLSNDATIVLRTADPGTFVTNVTVAGTGTLINTATGLIDIRAGVGGGRTLNVELDNRGSITSDTSFTVPRSGAEHDNSGDIILSSGDIVVSGAQSFTNSNLMQATTGNVSLTGNSAAGSLLTNTASGSIVAGGNITIGGFRTIDNDGTITPGGDVQINGVGGIATTLFDHSGSLAVPAGSSFTMTAGSSTAHQMVIQPGSIFDPGDAFNLNRVTLVLNRDLDIGTADLDLDFGVVSGSGTLTRGNGSSAAVNSSTLSADHDTGGVTTFTGGNDVLGAFTNRSTGTVELSPNSTVRVGDEDFSNEGDLNLVTGAGSIILTNASGATGSLVNTPSGTLDVAAGGGSRFLKVDIDNRGQFNVNSTTGLNRNGGSLVNSGTVTAPARLATSDAQSFGNSGNVTSTGGSFGFDGNVSGTSSWDNSGTLTSTNGLTIGQFENVTNSGRIDVTAGTATVALGSTSNAQQFSNTGDVEVAPGASFTFNNSWSGTITFEPGSTFDGGGDININSLALVLNGAYSPGGSPLNLSNVTVSGAGSLLVPSGGLLDVLHTTFNLPATNDGDAVFNSSNTISEGFLNQAASTVTVEANSNLTITNEDFTNHGLLELTGGTGVTTITSTDRTLVNSATGRIEIPPSAAERRINLNLDNEGELSVDAVTRLNRSDGTYSNSGRITASAALTTVNIGSFTNSGDLSSTGPAFAFDGNSTTSSFFDNSGVLTAPAGFTLGQFENSTNSGLIDLTGGTATISMGATNNPQQFRNSGEIEAAPGTTINFNNAWASSLTLDDGSTLDGGGNINVNSLALVLGGAYSSNTSPLTLSSTTLSGAGSLDVISGGSLTSSNSTFGVPTTNHGTVAFTTNTINATFTNEASATFTLANNSNLTITNEDFTNHGLLEFAVGGSVTTITSTDRTLVNSPTGTIDIPSSAQERRITLSLDNQGELTADSVVRLNRSGGTYQNSGTITASAQVRTDNIDRFRNTGTLASTGGNFIFDGNNSGTSLFENTGTLTVANGLTVSNFENSNNIGQIDVTGGNVTLNLGSTSNPQQFSNTGDMEIPAGSTLTVNNAWASSFALGDGATLDGGGDLNFGSVTLSLGGDYSPNTSPLDLASTTVSGPGSLTIIESSSIDATHATFNVPTTIDGTANFGTNTISNGFTNDVTGRFNLGNNANLTITGADFVNNGTMQFVAGTIVTSIVSTGQTLVNSPSGTINVPAGSGERRFSLNFDNQGTLLSDSSLRWNRANGVYANSGAITASAQLRTDNVESVSNLGTITSTGGNLYFDGNSTGTSSFDNAGTITAANGLTINNFESSTNSGRIDLTGGHATINLGTTSNPQSFANNGDIEIPAGSSLTVNNSWVSTFTLADGSTLEGGGDLNIGSVNLVLAGDYSPETSPLHLTSTTTSGPGTLTIRNGRTFDSTSGTLSAHLVNHGTATMGTNSINGGFENAVDGTFLQSNNTTLTITNADIINHGAMEMAAGTSLSTITSGTRTLINSPSGTIELPAGTGERRFDLSFDNQGELTIDSNLRFSRGNTTVDNSGLITTSAVLRTNSAERFENSGTITATPGASSLSFTGNYTGTSLWDNSGTLTAGNTMGITGFENVTNSGVINLTGPSLSVSLGRVSNPQQFLNTGEIWIAEGAEFKLNNTWVSSGNNAAGALIAGSGTFNTTIVNFTNNGIVAPGFSTGVLTFSQNLSNTGTAEYEIEIASADGAGTGHDQIVVNGNLALGGTLKPRLLGGFNPTPSDSFIIMRTVGGELTGNFDAIEQPYAPFGTFNVTVDEALDQVVLTFTGTGPLSFDDYQEIYFTAHQIANGDADPDADFDGDGLTTFAEWVHGFDPTRTVRAVAPLRLERDENDMLELTFAEAVSLPEGSVTVSLLSSPDGETAFGPVPEADYEVLPVLTVPGVDNIQLVTLRITNPAWTAGALRLFRLQFTAVDP